MCSADKANFLVLFYTVDLVYVQPLGPGLHSRPGVDLIYVQLQDLVHIRSRPGLRTEQVCSADPCDPFRPPGQS